MGGYIGGGVDGSGHVKLLKIKYNLILFEDL